jgi:hypothetical protein
MRWTAAEFSGARIAVDEVGLDPTSLLGQFPKHRPFSSAPEIPAA